MGYGFRLLWLVALLAASSSVWSSDSTAADFDLSPFGTFEVKATTFGASIRRDEEVDSVSTQFENNIRSTVETWKQRREFFGVRKLTIQPRIEHIRLGSSSALPRASQIDYRLQLIDASNGALIGEPAFTDQAGGLNAKLTRGKADSEMLTRVLREAKDYLERQYQTAVARVAQRRAIALSERLASAEQGDISSQVLLGLMYSLGQDVPRDYEQAAAWWRKAAEKGDTSAQLHLAEAYANGRGVPADDAQAAEWFRKAAVQGNTQAQRALASLYEAGRGVPKDEKLALGWYQKAADLGDSAAKKQLARRVRDRTAFTSFENAARTLDPENGYDIQLAMDAMALKGRILTLRMNILQVVDDREFLLTTPFGDHLPGGRTFYGEVIEPYRGSLYFVDGQDVSLVGEVIGTYQYIASSGARRTVPRIRIYGLRSGIP